MSAHVSWRRVLDRRRIKIRHGTRELRLGRRRYVERFGRSEFRLRVVLSVLAPGMIARIVTCIVSGMSSLAITVPIAATAAAATTPAPVVAARFR